MPDAVETVWQGAYKMNFSQGDAPAWTPFVDDSFDDQRVTVAIHGFVPRDYWAKAIGPDPETGATTYKLLPLDRA